MSRIISPSEHQHRMVPLPDGHVTGKMPEIVPGDMIQVDPWAIARGRFAVVTTIDGKMVGYRMPFSPADEWIHRYWVHVIGKAVFWPDGSVIKRD